MLLLALFVALTWGMDFIRNILGLELFRGRGRNAALVEYSQAG